MKGGCSLLGATFVQLEVPACFLGLQGAPGPAAPPGAGGKNNNQMVFTGQLLAEACCGKSRSRCCIQPSVKRAKGKGERCSVGCVAPRMLVSCLQGFEELGVEMYRVGRQHLSLEERTKIGLA